MPKFYCAALIGCLTFTSQGNIQSKVNNWLCKQKTHSTNILFYSNIVIERNNHFSMQNIFKGPSTLATLFIHRWPRFCGGDIKIFYSGRKPLFSSFGEHTAVCGSSVRQAVARPRHRQSVCSVP